MSLTQSFCALIVLLMSAFARADRPVVSYPTHGKIPAGSVVIETKTRKLYFIIDSSRAIQYPVAVPQAGLNWSGYTRVKSLHSYPAWSPPAIVRRRNPHLPDVIPGGHPTNPMGVAAIMLEREEIAIHGTSRSMRGSIGSAASSGCIRMLNEDVSDLYHRVAPGTLVLKR